MFLDRLKYELQLMGKKVILTPILVMVGFALFAEMLYLVFHSNPARFLSGGLEMILPVAAGVLVATVVTQDPVLELHLTLPRKYHLTAMRRLLLIVGWTIGIALVSSALILALKLGYLPRPIHSWSGFQQSLAAQLTWLAPLFWFVGVGLCFALLTHSRTASGALLAGIWIAEVVFKDYIFITAWLRPVGLFPTTLVFPQVPVPQVYIDMWWANRFEVLGTGLVLLLVGWLLLRDTEGLL